VAGWSGRRPDDLVHGATSDGFGDQRITPDRNWGNSTRALTAPFTTNWSWSWVDQPHPGPLCRLGTSMFVDDRFPNGEGLRPGTQGRGATGERHRYAAVDVLRHWGSVTRFSIWWSMPSIRALRSSGSTFRVSVVLRSGSGPTVSGAGGVAG